MAPWRRLSKLASAASAIHVKALVLWGWVHWHCLQPPIKAGFDFSGSKQICLNSSVTIIYKSGTIKMTMDQLHQVSAQCGREGDTACPYKHQLKLEQVSELSLQLRVY